MFFWDMLNDSLCHEDFSKKGDHQEYAPRMRGSRSNFQHANPRNMPPPDGNSRAVGSTYANPLSGQQRQGQQRQGQQGGQRQQGGEQNPRSRGLDNDQGSYGPWSSKPPPNSRPTPGDSCGQSRAQGNSHERGDGHDVQAQQSPQQAQPKQAANRRRQQENRKENSETRDTVIGRGFTAAMKRGVAQAKPTLAREELQQQKDGGFISTIQRGFEGLFGRPSSKEEVLRKRGAVFANEYEAVPGDEIDQKVQYFARRLPEDVAGCIKIFRDRKGEYQINDEIVNMQMKYRQAPNGQTESEIFVSWETDHGEQSDFEPLPLYLQHAANVAFEVKQGGNVITQVPDHARMSFHDEVGTKLTDGSADARFNAMEVAARQAKMREEAAVEWRQKQKNPKKGTESPEQSPRGQQEAKQSQAEEISIVDQALQAMGIMQAQSQPQAFAAPAAAPTPVPYVRPPQGMGMPVAAPAPPQQPGYLMPQHQAAMSRQGTMYAYGSAAPMSGFQHMAPMQQGVLRPSYASMYSTSSAYTVPVR